MFKTLLLGEAPMHVGAAPFDGRSSSMLDRLFGRPWQLCAIARNLLPPQARIGKGREFDAAEARRSARELMDRLLRQAKEDGHLEFASIVCAGKRVAEAVGFGDLEYFQWGELPMPSWAGSIAVGVIPHPSGVVRCWNDQATVLAAQAFLREAVRS